MEFALFADRQWIIREWVFAIFIKFSIDNSIFPREYKIFAEKSPVCDANKFQINWSINKWMFGIVADGENRIIVIPMKYISVWMLLVQTPERVNGFWLENE